MGIKKVIRKLVLREKASSEAFIEYLTKIGINGIESNYQYLNFKNTPEIKEEITKSKKIAKEFNLWETGGTDSHCKNIFHPKAQEILDTLI